MKTPFGSIIWKTGIAIISDLVIRLSNVLFFILLTWKNGSTDASAFSVGFVYASFLTALCLGGLEQLLNREISGQNTEGDFLLGNFLLARVLVGISLFIGLVVWVAYFGAFDPYTVLLILSLGTTIVSESVINLLQSVLIAVNRVGFILTLNLIFGLLRLLVGLGFVFFAMNALMIAVWTTLVSWLVAFFYLVVVWRMFMRPRISFDRDFWIRYAKTALPIILVSLMVAMERGFDSIFMSMGGAQSLLLVGAYSAANSVLNAMSLIPNSFRQILLSSLAAHYHKQRQYAIHIYLVAFRWSLFLSLLLCLVIGLNARHIVLLLYRDAFTAAIPVLQILIWSWFWTMLLVPNGRLILTAGLQDKAILPQFIGMLINVGLNLILQPSLTLVGAAIAKVVSTAVIFWGHLLLVFQELHRWDIRLLVRTALSAGLVFVLVFAIFDWLHVHWIIVSIFGVAAYFVVLYFYGEIDRAKLLAVLHSIQHRLSFHSSGERL